jgi:NAD(P)-dependent dehydrogenase (short-subunit alcohol dehydrogenase family)
MSTARRLGQTHRIVLASQSADKNIERQAALREDGIDAVAVRCDITDPASVAELSAFVAERGPLRTLAHVAGLSPSSGSWPVILRVNLVGAALMERACLALVTQGSAAVFVSSSAGHLAVPPSADIVAVLDDPLVDGFVEQLEKVVEEHTPLRAYQLSKWALNRMCRRRSSAWGARGARIVSMSPGPIATPMGARELEGPARDLKLQLMEKLPIRREGTMTETADAIEFLASDKASYITGTDLLVDGGITAATKYV